MMANLRQKTFKGDMGGLEKDRRAVASGADYYNDYAVYHSLESLK
jgi:hypothetical protein